MEWTKHIPRYEMMAPFEQAEVKRLFEQAYALIMSRCWFEVRKIWLDYITHSTNSILHKVAHVFWRDKFQEKCGNLPHIHGLVALDKTDMENEELLELLFSLQECGVMDMFSTKSEDMQNYIDLGLFKSETDWFMHTYLGQKILGHRCSPRCKVRISDGDGPECFRCRKIDPVLGSNNPLEQEFIPLHYKFSNECLSVLEECSLYEPPGEHQLYGMFHHSMFTPSRHMGICNPSNRHNISPANDIWFAATKSMQNFQILTGTNGVARYVVKYVTKLDEGNRCVVFADAHTGAVMRVDHQFLHNTKIARSKANVEKAYAKTRNLKHPTGRSVAVVETVQQLLGYSEVMKTLTNIHIATTSFEERGTTQVKVDYRGNLQRPDRGGENDVHSTTSVSQVAREKEGIQHLTENQQLLYRHDGVKADSYDHITQYSLRPVEMLKLFASLGNYFRWFHTSNKCLSLSRIQELIADEPEMCGWVDALGMRVLL